MFAVETNSENNTLAIVNRETNEKILCGLFDGQNVDVIVDDINDVYFEAFLRNNNFLN